MDAVRVPTELGELAVRIDGTGPPAVLWHSLFVDSTSFEMLAPLLAARRRLLIVDGPGHGRSQAPATVFTMTECAGAAATILDHLDIAEPADWVGCAWGGHVGLEVAADQPRRIRTLTTIGTPTQALSTSERLTQAYPLLALYRLAGPIGPVRKALTDALLGAKAVATQPDLSHRVMAAFCGADRSAMFTAIRSVMLRRRTFTRLNAVAAPTLMIAAGEDPFWNADMARAAAAQMRAAAAVPVSGQAHIAPLLLEPELLAEVICEFWSQPTEYIDARARG